MVITILFTIRTHTRVHTHTHMDFTLVCVGRYTNRVFLTFPIFTKDRDGFSHSDCNLSDRNMGARKIVFYDGIK